MNDQTNEPNRQNGDQPGENAPPGKRRIDTVFTAVRTGADDARKAAEEAIPKIKDAASRASYWAAYGISFGVTFQWSLLRVGGRDGIKAGKEAAARWLERFQRNETANSERSRPPLIGPASEEAHPGVA